MTTAEAPPPPLHMAAAPILALFCSKTFNNVMIRALSSLMDVLVKRLAIYIYFIII
jgi:hypothetical protein